ncbi:hypothetical protein Pse7429DRAFT_0731 [Pseudanabaena biceps PCC 7429]|uniref:Uncharacterized protein n=1 Tax=Pseudanabaena biceps PCC 7429 TaxID=927668 RepID=L8N676_9CYAN|nr:hypothetical protein Pse7429DRAFT_0731 [Pseudanabaena biceps PCC 7429]
MATPFLESVLIQLAAKKFVLVMVQINYAYHSIDTIEIYDCD